MEPSTSIIVHDRFAADYDRQVREYHCFAADVLFGLCFEYVQPRERLLDVGIGTGLSALPFVKAGLQVFGIDASLEMLKICGSKNAGIALEQFDLRNQPWPYTDSFFDHVVSCGVLHFFDDLDTIFHQVARVVRTNGTFAFSTKAPPLANAGGVEEKRENVAVFTHGREYIDACVAKHGFKMLKHMPFFVENDSGNYAELFLAFVIQK